jgi:hypothetical protein
VNGSSPEKSGQPRGARNRPEVDLLLSCAHTQITPEAAARIRTAVEKDVDWLALIRLAMRHEVMPLLYRNLQQVCPDSVPDHISGPLRTRYEAQAAQARRDAEELVRVLAVFADRGIAAVPYKGPALAQRLYGDLSLRPFGDLDILVRELDIPRAQGLIRRLGYEFVSLKDTDKLAEYLRTDLDCELRFYRCDGTSLELHWRFARRLACVPHDPERFLQRSEMIRLAGAKVPSLPLEVYFLILSLHATKHKWGQLKLICDLAEIVGHADLDWRYVLREAHSLGLRRMLAVGALLAEDPLDAALPAELAQGLKIDRAARAMAAEVRSGLFEEPGQACLELANLPFQFRIRERLRDKTSMLYQNLLAKLAPNELDRRFLPMPEFLSPMYYVVRPVRWVWEKIERQIG